MGRQLQICTTELDDRVFAEYLQSNFNCLFFQSFAPTKEELLIQDINETFYPFSSIYIWNPDFDWKPEYAQDNTEKQNFYISNKFNAPLIQFSKIKESHYNGRIYWSKHNSENYYDIDAFELFYNTIRKWLTTNSAGTIKEANVNIYFLEDAWKNKNKCV